MTVWVISRPAWPCLTYLKGLSVNPIQQSWTGDYMDEIQFVREEDARQVENILPVRVRIVEI